MATGRRACEAERSMVVGLVLVGAVVDGPGDGARDPCVDIQR